MDRLLKFLCVFGTVFTLFGVLLSFLKIESPGRLVLKIPMILAALGMIFTIVLILLKALKASLQARFYAATSSECASGGIVVSEVQM